MQEQKSAIHFTDTKSMKLLCSVGSSFSLFLANTMVYITLV